MNEKKTALYLRSAREDDEAIKAQEATLRAFADEKGYGNIEIYADNGHSGDDMSRPAFNKLNADIETGSIGAVIVQDVSRINRGGPDTMKWVVDNCKDYNISFMTVTGDSWYSDNADT